MSNLNFIIKGEAQTAARFEAKARQFRIVIDEPPYLGGNDKGANPFEYLLASFGGCLKLSLGIRFFHQSFHFLIFSLCHAVTLIKRKL